MVVAMLVSYWAPSARGVFRGRRHRSIHTPPSWNVVGPDNTGETPALLRQRRQLAAQQRPKRFKAMTCLISLASDIDVISDWVFLWDSNRNDEEYRAERDEHDGSLPYLIPPPLMWFTFFCSVLGTFMWLVLATEGRIMAPLLRRLGFDKLSIGHVLFLCVVLEDIPQVVLTFLIEEYYEESALSNLAIVNVVASLYDTLIKLAEAYDERNDIVETGDWCKESLWAHHDTVTSILALPRPSTPTPNTSDGNMSISQRSVRNFGTLVGRRPPLPPLSSSNRRSLPSRIEGSLGKTHSSHSFQDHRIRQSSQSSLPTTTTKALGGGGGGGLGHSFTKRQPSVLDEALMPIAPFKVPRLKFLTASLDKTVRLWDTTACRKGHKREKCIRVFRGHSAGVTCIALLGHKTNRNSSGSIANNNNNNNNQSMSMSMSMIPCYENFDLENQEEEEEQTTFFLTGCKYGDIKLWNLAGKCVRTFFFPSNMTAVTGLAIIQSGVTFVSSHQDGSVRLWEAWSGLCIGIYKGHSEAITCVCSMKNSKTFVTGSEDTTLKLWDTSDAMTSFSQISVDAESIRRLTVSADQTVHEEFVCSQTFSVRIQESMVLSVVCLEASTALVAGYADGVARLWSAETGACLRVFVGHLGPVTSIELVDQFSILTGSSDNSIQLWDTLSGVMLRRYAGHTDDVTSISITYDDHVFLTASADHTLKIWHLSSIQKRRPDMDLVGPLEDIYSGDTSTDDADSKTPSYELVGMIPS